MKISFFWFLWNWKLKDNILQPEYHFYLQSAIYYNLGLLLWWSLIKEKVCDSFWYHLLKLFHAKFAGSNKSDYFVSRSPAPKCVGTSYMCGALRTNVINNLECSFSTQHVLFANVVTTQIYSKIYRSLFTLQK